MKVVKFFDMVVGEYSEFGRDFIDFSFVCELTQNKTHFHMMGAYTIDSPQYEGKWEKPFFHNVSIMVSTANVQLKTIPFYMVKALTDYLEGRD